MPRSDKPGVGGHEQPPPTRLRAMAGVAVALDAATVLALLLDNCDIATVLAILALLFGAIVFMMASGGSDKPGVGTHEQPPP